MASARLVRVSAAVVLWVAAAASLGVAGSPSHAARAQADGVDLSRERALLDGAKAALASSDYVAARAKAAEATGALLARASEERSDAWLALLDLAGHAAWSAQDPRTAHSAWEPVLEVRSASLPEDHRVLQEARLNLALTMEALGDLEGARALEERALEVLARTLPGDHPYLQSARMNLAETMKGLGDFAGALALEEQVLEVRSRALADDHRDLQRVRGNLATTLLALGDVAGARALQERVLDAFSRTLPPDHPDLQTARVHLAKLLHSSGELAGARALFEQALGAYARTLPEGHHYLQSARLRLATTLVELGELEGARSLQERVLEVYALTLPEGDLTLEKARANLALTLRAQGDLPGARALEERVLEVFSRALPEDHSDLQRARHNLATTMHAQGDLAGAKALQERVLEVLARTLPGDHPVVQRARHNLAVTMYAQGDTSGARALEQRVLEALARTRPADHPDLQAARQNLAVALKESGDLAGARALEESVLAVRSATLPEGHPDSQAARVNLALTIASEAALAGEEERHGARERCAELLLDVCRSQTAGARAVLLSAPSREAEERCARIAEDLDLALSFARGRGVFERTPALEVAAFELGETTRGAALAAARLARRAAGDARYGERRAAFAREVEALASLVRRQGASAEDFEDARARRDSAERELLSLAREVLGGAIGGVDLSAQALSTALGPRAASVGYRRFRSWRVEVQGGAADGDPPSARQVWTDRLLAFVVRGAAPGAGESLIPVDLGPCGPIEAAVRAWRDAVGAAEGRGLSSGEPLARGDVLASGEALRRLVFDPLRAVIDDSERVVLVLDDVLHLVAFDALPLGADGASLVGDRWAIETRATLTELLDPDSEPRRAGGFLGVGGVSYDGDEAGGSPAAIAPAASGRGRAGILRGGPWREGFTALPAARVEAEGIGRSFAAHAPGAPSTVLGGAEATKEQLLARAPAARFLHVATHGWFAPESIRSWSDPRPIDEQLGLGARLTGAEQVRGMSPMLLCGLALSGANLPEDAVGRAPGLITAEELAALDLSSCELAVLSACDTNVGERRGGQGVASLQRALQMAGARTVITSLWKVPDEATKDLMLDFYRRIWVEGKPKAQALWEAKRRLREAVDERGEPLYGLRDWAAWVLTGEPR